MMSRPTKRDGSRNHYFAKRLPAAIADALKGRKVEFKLPGERPLDPETSVVVTLRDPFRLSLKTDDAHLAKKRQAAVEEQFADLVQSAKDGPRALTFKEVVALAGVWYRELVADWSANPGDPEEWDQMQELVTNALEAAHEEGTRGEWESLEKAIGADRFLQSKAIRLDTDTHRRFLLEAGKALALGAASLSRMAVGDYKPDPEAERFPAWEKKDPAPAPTSKGSVQTFDDLFARWRATGDKAPSTVTNWRTIIGQFKAFLGHDDPAAVNQADVIRWKDHLLVSGKKRIDDTNLACLRAIYAPSVDEKVITGILINPAIGVSARQARKQAGQTKLPYSDSEVAELLAVAAKEAHPNRRWLPLLLACTGARVGELVQIWGENVTTIEGISALHIRPAPDGGTLKNDVSERTIPLHPELIRQGFLEFVRKHGPGPLFYSGQARRGRKAARARPEGEGRHASKGVANHLAGWIRKQGFNDPRKAPSHAFRHWMKTALLKAGVPERVADAIQGHAGRSEADTYRHVDLAMMAEGLEKIAIPLPKS